MTPSFEIRTTTETDVPIILSLIRELADYERAPDAVVRPGVDDSAVLDDGERFGEIERDPPFAIGAAVVIDGVAGLGGLQGHHHLHSVRAGRARANKPFNGA